MKITKQEPSINQLKNYIISLIETDYGISHEVRSHISAEKHSISNELSNEEYINLLSDKEFILLFSTIDLPCELAIYPKELYHIYDDKGAETSKGTVTGLFNGWEGSEFFIVENFGLQILSIYHKTGVLVDEGAHFISCGYNGYYAIQYLNGSDHGFYYQVKRFHNSKVVLISDCYGFEVGDNFHPFVNKKSFFINGFIDENFKAITPFCFSSGSVFSEELAVVCCNGKWGYINNDLKIALPFSYGYAESFYGGYARVLVLNEKYTRRSGAWIPIEDQFDPFDFIKKHQIETNIPIDQITSELTILKPDSDLQADFSNEAAVEYIEQYHTFEANLIKSLVDLSTYGTISIIKYNGEIIYEETSKLKISKVVKGQILLNELGKYSCIDLAKSEEISISESIFNNSSNLSDFFTYGEINKYLFIEKNQIKSNKLNINEDLTSNSYSKNESYIKILEPFLIDIEDSDKLKKEIEIYLSKSPIGKFMEVYLPFYLSNLPKKRDENLIFPFILPKTSFINGYSIILDETETEEKLKEINNNIEREYNNIQLLKIKLEEEMQNKWPYIRIKLDNANFSPNYNELKKRLSSYSNNPQIETNDDFPL